MPGPEPDLELLRRAEPPWTLTIVTSPGHASEVARTLKTAGTVARVLRGSMMTTPRGFYDEVSAALQFPDYFGENIAALDECLADLSWLPGAAYVVVVTDAHLLFRDEATDTMFPAVLASLARAGASWAAPTDTDKPWGHGSVPFHVLFQVPETAIGEWNRRLADSVAG